MQSAESGKKRELEKLRQARQYRATKCWSKYRAAKLRFKCTQVSETYSAALSAVQPQRARALQGLVRCVLFIESYSFERPYSAISELVQG